MDKNDTMLSLLTLCCHKEDSKPAIHQVTIQEFDFLFLELVVGYHEWLRQRKEFSIVFHVCQCLQGSASRQRRATD